MARHRPFRRGDRVTRRAFRTGDRAADRGVILLVEHDPLAGRCATVRWDDGSEQLCLTSDLQREVR